MKAKWLVIVVALVGLGLAAQDARAGGHVITEDAFCDITGEIHEASNPKGEKIYYATTKGGTLTVLDSGGNTICSGRDSQGRPCLAFVQDFTEGGNGGEETPPGGEEPKGGIIRKIGGAIGKLFGGGKKKEDEKEE